MQTKIRRAGAADVAYTEPGDRAGDELDVAPAPVALRGHPPDQVEALEDAEVVSEQVRLDMQDGSELRWGSVGKRELVDDGQAVRIAQRPVDPRARSSNPSTNLDSIVIEVTI